MITIASNSKQKTKRKAEEVEEVPTHEILMVLFEQQGHLLERHFTLEAFQRCGDKIEIGTDASPWGIGGWMTINGKVKFFSL